jgi:hypothetical protein
MSMYLMREELSPQAWKTIAEGGMDPHPLSDPQTMAARALGRVLVGMQRNETTGPMSDHLDANYGLKGC